MREQALPMDEAKQKLARLEKLIPDTHDGGLLYSFGRYLAGYLNSELVPMGFLLACELALHDLRSGVNGFTGEPIQGRFVGQPSMVYALLRWQIPNIADAIFPEEFATSVKHHFERIKTEMRAAEIKK